MNSRIRTARRLLAIHFLATGSLALPLSGTGQAAGTADELWLAPRQGVVLLNNGEVIQGTITAAGDRYDVAGKDSEIHVKRSDVAAVCQDLAGCYLHRRRGIEQGRAADHLDLAEWCLKHALIEQAEGELQAARSADNTHPRIRLLEPRLELARQTRQKPQPSQAQSRAASGELLDEMVRHLPPGSMEHFTNNIQPMLLNYCAKSGCHGPRSSTALKLDRIGPNRLMGRHVTQSNLQAVLAAIDRDAPANSKLLAAPIRPHGNMKAPVFTDREQIQYKQLVQWVYLVSQVKEASTRPTLEERTAPLLQNVSRPGQPNGQSSGLSSTQRAAAPAAKSKSPLDDWSQSFPDQAKAPQGRSKDAEHETASGSSGSQDKTTPATDPGGAAADDFVPRDPFDPEIFNRRFHPR